MNNAADKNDANIQAAMGDLLAIRRSIISFSAPHKGKVTTTSYQANKRTQYIALGLCLIIAAIEIFSQNFITNTLMNSVSSGPMKIEILTWIGIFLILCTATLYIIVKNAASAVETDLSSYIRKNFQYLQNLSHLSDLFIKFAVVAALVLAMAPQWVAVFLFLFTADYLFQGRYFTLKIRTAHLLGVALIFAAGLQFYFGDTRVLWPLLSWAAVNVLSIVHLNKMKVVED